MARWDSGIPWVFWPTLSISTKIPLSQLLLSCLQDFTFIPRGRIRAESESPSGCSHLFSFLLSGHHVARWLNSCSIGLSLHILSGSPLSQSGLSHRDGSGFTMLGWHQSLGASQIFLAPALPPSFLYFGRNGMDFPPSVGGGQGVSGEMLPIKSQKIRLFVAAGHGNTHLPTC